MTNIEILQAINTEQNPLYWTKQEQNVAINEAVEAIEKQIPKKPDAEDCCILCSTYLKDDNGVEGGYCPNCGQRVKW